MKIYPIKPVIFNNARQTSKIYFQNSDKCDFENRNFDKKIFIERKIIQENKNINSFFDEVSNSIFLNDEISKNLFSQFLKKGKISLSSNAYKDLNNPQSACAIEFDKNMDINSIYSILDDFIQKGIGVGINFSKMENPTEKIKQINSYFQLKKTNCIRPPAGIALLDIKNSDILNFITLKDDESYDDWCFDLSVIIDDDFLNKLKNNETITLTNGKKIKVKEIYDTLLNSMLKKGEPGIIFSNNPDYICDCCASCELKKNENLTLGQINLSKFISKSNFDFNSLLEASFILNKAMKKLDKNSYVSILGYQDLLNQMGLKYGSKEAIELLEKIIKTIKYSKAKIAISPTGTISRFLKTSPNIEPDKTQNIDYEDEINTLSVVQKLIEGQISKTIQLKKDATISDVDKIIQYSKQKDLKGISVFKP